MKVVFGVDLQEQNNNDNCNGGVKCIFICMPSSTVLCLY